MAPETLKSAAVEPERFYTPLALDYDAMTGFDRRLAAAETFLRKLGDGTRFASVLDTACGTGVYALAAARLSRTATGTDLSDAMLVQARQHAARLGLEVAWFSSRMEECAARLDRAYDLVLCMGNSVPHLLTDAALQSALRSFRQALVPGGHLAIQLLNYTRIIERQERIVEVTRQDSREFVRFYDFLDGTVRFNVLRLDWPPTGAARHDLSSVELRPYQKDELVAALVREGFGAVQAFGGLGMSSFAPDESETLLLLAERTP